ncbi:MAG: ferrochelatase [Bdellovibrionaceae bacterium]|nr:ferrochelatase [Pseudobdellovibrionaceae bacterium]
MSTTGVLIGNLGTPKSYTVSDVRAYLSQFLMDKYVIDKSALFRWLLVKLIIVPFRAKKSAKLYESVWTEKGSPLLVNSESVVQKLQVVLGDTFKVSLGMRYGSPNIENALLELKDCESIVLFPQYPQFADSSYTTWMDEVLRCADKLKVRKKLKIIPPFYANSLYLDALEKNLRSQLEGKDIDHLLFSFHGLPVRHLTKLDMTGKHCMKKPNCCDSIVQANTRCYRAQSFYVASNISSRLKMEGRASVSFQSRLGREPWIQPFTDQELEKMPSRGIKKMAVAMPAFTADCLETLEEIHVLGAETFKKAGGEEFYPLYCLNDDDHWIEALAQMVKNVTPTASSPLSSDGSAQSISKN